jgi:uncharacterized protein YecE (DUF72 family)
VRFYASPAQEAVAKFKGQKGSDVRFLFRRTRFFMHAGASRVAHTEHNSMPMTMIARKTTQY